MNHLSIRQLSLQYPGGLLALDQISLDITNGIFGLLGPNGAGKSSLMKVITGLQRPRSGHISFNGTDVLKQPAFIRSRLGFLPQDFGVYPKVSAYTLLQHLASLKGVGNHRERKAQILSLLDKVNLLQVKDKEVHTFSGGMRQRFGIAQALLGNPQIIIADEPTAGLDPEERNRLHLLLSEISMQVIVILSTHLVEDVRTLCHQMAIISQGRLLTQGSPENMIRELEGKVWTRAIPPAERQAYAAHPFIGQQLTGKVLHIAIHSEQQPEGFLPLAPTLEHVYFHTLNHS